MKNLVSRDIKDKLKGLELKLLNPQVRNSVDEISNLLFDDFKEISKSGSMYSKEDVLDHLPIEKGQRLFKTENWVIENISSKVVLINYISSESTDDYFKKTYRTSLWKKFGNSWKMIFHQGTNKKV